MLPPPLSRLFCCAGNQTGRSCQALAPRTERVLHPEKPRPEAGGLVNRTYVSLGLTRPLYVAAQKLLPQAYGSIRELREAALSVSTACKLWRFMFRHPWRSSDRSTATTEAYRQQSQPAFSNDINNSILSVSSGCGRHTVTTCKTWLVA